MGNINEHIENFLDYYCGLPYPPEYAVFLKGPWGCGKTWFIEQYYKKLKRKGYKYIYVSLYGVRSLAEIKSSFFQELYPLLSSKGFSFAFKILKGLLWKINLTNSSYGDVSINSLLPDILLADFIDTSGYILIFDDIERCSMEMTDLLGYINNFVEHKKYKAIIIGDEDKINQNKSSEIFKNMKEKLIGKTFQVEDDVNDALNDFISKIQHEGTKIFLKRNKALIMELYRMSGYKNLRHIKQALWDFEKLFKEFSPKISEKEDLLQQILRLFLAFSFEIKSGNLFSNEIKGITSLYSSELVREMVSLANHKEKIQEKSPIIKLFDKYQGINLFDLLINESCWEDIFDKGLINIGAIEESLLKSRYFQDENTPNWIKLWHFTDMNDDEFNNILEVVKKEYSDRMYTEEGIIKHVTGIFLWLSDKGLYNKIKNEILIDAKSYIDHLKNKGHLKTQINAGFMDRMDRESWGGLGFLGLELQEFKEFLDYVKHKKDEAKIDSMPDAGKELIEIMKSDTDKFYRMITLSNSSDQIYFEIPIFMHITPEDFVNAFLSLNPESQRRVASALKRRYEYATKHNELLSELEWLKNIRSILVEKQKSLTGKPSGYLIGSIIERHLDKIIEDLEKRRSP
jgi:hypothetical protein